MIKASDLPMELGKRQKRIAYWRENFPKNTSNSALLRSADELINKFALMLSKLSKEDTEEAINTTFAEVQAIERELTSLFEYSRLKTTVKEQYGFEKKQVR
ncbi:MAG: hypothetical protein KDD66_13220 [Bdellovibrionales bacterium]|nr:hypothetical protein [Bdellovibrionales bacterium]